MGIRRPALLVLCAALSCGDGGGTPAGPDAMPIDFDRRAFLENLARNVVLPTLDTFDARADVLVDAVRGWCTALGGVDEAARRVAAQDAWRAAMTTWQEAEVMQFGPAAMDSGALRDRINSWDVVSSCAVDQEVMARLINPAAYDLSTKLTNRRGLPALEYVVFTTNLAVTCAPQAAPAGWADLSDADKQAARCGFADVAAVDLAAQAQALRDAWAVPPGGDYATVLANAGTSGSPFTTAHAAVNVVSDAMFYLDSDVKDMKLGRPAGIMMNSCGTIQEPCLADLESPWAPHSKENVIANLRGFRMLFVGDGPGSAMGGLGFDDFLAAVNSADLATAMTQDLDAAIAAVEAIPGTLGEAVQASPATVVAAHAAIKKVTDNLKSQFLTVLGLDLPDGLGDDTD